MSKTQGLKGALGVAGLACLGLTAGCGSSANHAGTPTTAGSHGTGTSATTAPAATTIPTTLPSTSASTATTTTPPTVPPTTTLIGLTLDGSGNTFTAPAAPTTKPASSDCQTLVDTGFYGSCVLVVSPSGTIAALVEQQQQNYQSGQPITPGQERDLVYREVNGAWSLVLRRTPVAAGESITEVSESDIMRDGDPKAVFVEPAVNSSYGNELDIVEGSGMVTLYRQLHGGFATIAAGGSLATYVPDTASGYDQATIAYSAGAWKITAASHVSDSQAQSLTSQAFYDPTGVAPTS